VMFPGFSKIWYFKCNLYRYTWAAASSRGARSIPTTDFMVGLFMSRARLFMSSTACSKTTAGAGRGRRRQPAWWGLHEYELYQVDP
jgi:hypothetical protein